LYFVGLYNIQSIARNIAFIKFVNRYT